MNRADEQSSQKGRRRLSNTFLSHRIRLFEQRYLYFNANLLLHKYELLLFIAAAAAAVCYSHEWMMWTMEGWHTM